MTGPKTPIRKNPILRTPQPTLPPDRRSRVALGLTAGAAIGRFELQVCLACGAAQYPPREACHVCLSDRLRWRPHDGRGELISETTLRHAQELYFRERLPWRLGLVRLDAGPTVVAHLHAACGPAPARVAIRSALDRSGQPVMVATPEADTALADDPKLRDMTCDPQSRKILVTDGKTAVGQAMVRAALTAGADLVWVGCAEPWKQPPGFADVAALARAAVVPLDVTDSRSVSELAGRIGGKVDILINTADHHRAFGVAARDGIETAQAEMEVNYFGLLRLAQAFAPVLRARAADGPHGAVAWVNILSIYALTNFPPHGTYSAAQAAALSLSQGLRADMRASGIRVINVLPGPIDDEWSQLILPPKLAPAALARAVMAALESSVEDVFPGDVAQDWLARWRDDAKTLERELSGSSR
jgi:NAD(P)-dependent dehydrogenase (short-subunit alcohol dehydrogenase family)/uncharacterized OB-fold protein